MKIRKDTVQLPNGKVLDDYFVWLEGDVVFVIAATVDRRLILIKQYKQAAQDTIIEFAAGYIDKGETAEAAARRELLEETGYDAKKLTKVFEGYSNSSKIVGRYVYFFAEDCFIPEVNSHKPDATEDIEVLTVTPEEAYSMLQTNQINTSAGTVGVYLALERVGFLKKA